MREELFERVDSLKTDMIEMLSKLISIPAINPDDGGSGEYKKAQFILQKLKRLGFDEVEMYNSEDPYAEGEVRPNIVVRQRGETDRRMWIVTHLDVVPEGERSLWKSNPFEAHIEDDKIYGRGSSDNGQEIISSLFALLSLKKTKIIPKFEICLCMVSDEESGSVHGIQHLIKQGLFKKDDLVIVPDFGSSDGSFIQISEKSVCWIEFEVFGIQAHASTPSLGINSCRVANEFSTAIDKALHTAFPDEDPLFSPPNSTFEPTCRIGNVSNVNTIPGKERFCFDCRVLPNISLNLMESVIDREIKRISDKYKVKITCKFLQREQAPTGTSKDAEIVCLLQESLSQVLSIVPKVGGIGGGTCAAFLRREGIPVAVWCQEDPVAHMPNEYAKIEHMLNEAKVFAQLMSGL